MGLDMSRFLDRTQEMVEACGANVASRTESRSPAGIILGTAARNGRDKVTIITSPGISDLGAWLEQLIAESTGKHGKGIIPVDREDLGSPEVYGNDRVFAYLRLESAPDKAQDAKVAALEQAGHPVVRIAVARHLRSRPGILPLGNRHGGRRLDHRHQSLQPARRRSQQDRHSQSDRLNTRRPVPARGEADSRGRRHQAVHRCQECRRSGQSCGQR